MKVKHSDSSKAIFEKIDSLFADEVGLVADMLCEEALLEWIMEIKKSKQRLSLRLIPKYVDKLACKIESAKGRDDFLDAVYEIEALKLSKRN